MLIPQLDENTSCVKVLYSSLNIRSMHFLFSCLPSFSYHIVSTMSCYIHLEFMTFFVMALLVLPSHLSIFTFTESFHNTISPSILAQACPSNITGRRDPKRRDQVAQNTQLFSTLTDLAIFLTIICIFNHYRQCVESLKHLTLNNEN